MYNFFYKKLIVPDILVLTSIMNIRLILFTVLINFEFQSNFNYVYTEHEPLYQRGHCGHS